MLTRRHFIKAMGVVGGAVMAPFRWFGQAQAAPVARGESPAGAELYGGFVLLPEGAPVPAFVKPRRLPDPDRCGMTVDDSTSNPKVMIETFDDIARIRTRVNFPVYSLSGLPGGLHQDGSYIASNELGDVYGISIIYKGYDSTNNLWATAVSLWMQPDFSRPFPLWQSIGAKAGGPFVALEKVDYLPSPGIKVGTPLGFVCHWIEEDTLFILTAEPSPTGQDARALIGLLDRS